MNKIFKKRIVLIVAVIIALISSTSASAYNIKTDNSINYNNIVENYSNNTQGLAYIFIYNNGTIEDKEITIEEFTNKFYEDFGIRTIINTRRDEIYYNLDDLVSQGGFTKVINRSGITLSNNESTIVLEWDKNKSTNYLYGTRYRNNNVSYTDIVNKNYMLHIKNNELYVGENIYKMITEFYPSFEKYSIWYENGNLYVLDKTNLSVEDNFFINMNQEMIIDTIHGLYFLYKHCPDIYETVKTTEYIKRHIEVVKDTNEYSIELGGPDGFYNSGENGINITLKGLISEPDKIACILAHEAQHLSDYKMMQKCPEVSAYETTLKVMASLGKSVGDMKEYISDVIKSYNYSQWSIG